MKGPAYGLDGRYIATWESKFVSISVDKDKVYYIWSGYHRDTPSDTFEGIGEVDISFAGEHRIDKGRGFFSDVNFAEPGTARKKVFVLRRSTPEEDAVMAGSDEVAIEALIAQKLADPKPA